MTCSGSHNCGEEILYGVKSKGRFSRSRSGLTWHHACNDSLPFRDWASGNERVIAEGTTSNKVGAESEQRMLQVNS